ncbi:MAG: LysM peptidoglycan-binding domain-containing protein, partial [Ilumatobacteraceae bacterium]
MFRGFGYADSTSTATALAALTLATVESSVAVETGDTLWDLATGHYGFCDRDLIRLIQDANPTIDEPSRIYPGQTIVWPELFPATPGSVPAEQGEATWSAHVIVPGDTLWDILDTHYGHVDADLIWHIAELNNLENPSDIPIGTTITLPPAQPDSDAPQATNEPPDTTASAPEQADVEEQTNTDPIPDTADEHADSSTPDSAPSVPAPSRPAAPDTSPSSSPEAVPASTTPSTPRSNGRMESLAHRIGWQGPAALAAGMIALAATLRRERRRHTERPPTEPVRDIDLVMRTTPGASNVEWAAETLRGLSSQLRPRPNRPFPIPLCVQVSDDGIEILWTEPRPQLVDGWTTPNDGRSWHRARDLAPIETDVTAPCPALVTIGTQSESEVLL